MDSLKQDISEHEAQSQIIKEQQTLINEGTFTTLSAQYDEARRTADNLREALERAETRERILGGAIDRLNAPQTPQPSLR